MHLRPEVKYDCNVVDFYETQIIKYLAVNTSFPEC